MKYICTANNCKSQADIVWMMDFYNLYLCIFKVSLESRWIETCLLGFFKVALLLLPFLLRMYQDLLAYHIEVIWGLYSTNPLILKNGILIDLKIMRIFLHLFTSMLRC